MKFLFLLIILTPFLVFSQDAQINGRVFNELNNTSVAFATVKIIGTQKGAVSKSDGSFSILNLEPGIYSFKATASGYKAFYINVHRPVYPNK